MLGREFGLPVVITGRGADLNQIPAYGVPRAQILWAARRAAVSASLLSDITPAGTVRAPCHANAQPSQVGPLEPDTR